MKTHAAPPAEPEYAGYIGGDSSVPCVDGRLRRYVNLDHAASAPALQAVWEAIAAFVPWYSSVNRGAGYHSQVATAALEGAREAVAQFLDAPKDASVIFLRNTTEAINVLATALPARTRVLSSPAEHHANMLPWRQHEVQLLPFASSPTDLLQSCEDALLADGGAIELVAVTGASNVSGEVWPVAELAELAHAHGAEIFVDAAQLAPHRRVSMSQSQIDYLAVSGHKLYAPFGSGVLVARQERLRTGEPLLQGGGAVKLVTLEEVIWADLPDRFEAGSPNVVGIVALGAACDALANIGMDRVAAHERVLTERLASGLAGIADVKQLRLWPDGSCDRLGVFSFNLVGYRHTLLAAILSAEYAIGVRSGRFCAHPLVTHLLRAQDAKVDGIRDEVAYGNRERRGAVRASLGLGSGSRDVDVLVDALGEIAAGGAVADYDYDPILNEHRPVPDSRPWPELPVRMIRAPTPCELS